MDYLHLLRSLKYLFLNEYYLNIFIYCTFSHYRNTLHNLQPLLCIFQLNLTHFQNDATNLKQHNV